MRLIFGLIAAGVLALGAERAGAEVDPGAGRVTPLVFAVHPYAPPEEITARFTPLAEALARAVGRPVIVRVGRSYAEHIDAVGGDNVDLAYMGPASYVAMVSRYGVKPLLARLVIAGDPMLHGEVIVRQDSTIGSLQELRGKRFAFGDPDSTMSTAVPLAMLRNAGIPQSALGQAAFLKAPRNVALAVLAGDVDAGAVQERVFEQYAPRGLRSLAPEPLVPDHLLVASSSLSGEEVDAMRRTLLALAATSAGKSAMAALDPRMTGLIAVRDSDYDTLRTLMQLPLDRAHPHR